MARIFRTLFGVCLLLCLAQLPALAAGPIDGEFGLLWWQTDTDLDTELGDLSADDGAPGYRGEVWFFNKFGVRASMFKSELTDIDPDMDDADYMSADVMYRMFSPTENSFFAAGIGYEDAQFDVVDTSGFRLTAEGRIGFLPILHGYAYYTFMPDLDDYSDGTSEYTGMKGQEYELGVRWTITPFIDARAGYRATMLDFDVDSGAGKVSGSTDTAGFMIGMGVHF